MTIIRRATDSTFSNMVLNHPEVRKHTLHVEGVPSDITPLVSNPANVVMEGEYGGIIFHQVLAGLFEVHTYVLPEGRGKWALDMAHEAIEWMFCRTNASELYTRVPDGNVAAMALSRAVGAKLEQRVMNKINGDNVMVDIMTGRIQDWIKIAPGLIEKGVWFHARLHEKMAALGLTDDNHPPNEWHDRHVGAAVKMIEGGQARKGVIFYNRWAALALAPPIRMVSAEPVVVQMQDKYRCELRVLGEDFEVVPCLKQ